MEDKIILLGNIYGYGTSYDGCVYDGGGTAPSLVKSSGGVPEVLEVIKIEDHRVKCRT